MSKGETIIKQMQASWPVVRLTKAHVKDLQEFLQHFDDFFLLCEGEIVSAVSLLESCPKTKDANKDKFVFGINDDKNKKLIGVIDLISDFPSAGVWTIGYLLIHPAYRRKHIGQDFIKDLGTSLKHQGATKLRCGVQEQNPNALMFWQKCNFAVVNKISERLEKLTRQTYVLEMAL